MGTIFEFTVVILFVIHVSVAHTYTADDTPHNTHVQIELRASQELIKDSY